MSLSEWAPCHQTRSCYSASWETQWMVPKWGRKSKESRPGLWAWSSRCKFRKKRQRRDDEGSGARTEDKHLVATHLYVPWEPQFLIPGGRTLWGSIFLKANRGMSFHFFQKVTHIFRALASSSFSCLKSFLWGSRVMVSSQTRKNRKAHPTSFHSYHWAHFSERSISKLPRNH